MVECRTPEREVRGSRPTAAVLCPWARHFTPLKYWLITQEAMAPSRHDWKLLTGTLRLNTTNQQYIQSLFFLSIPNSPFYFQFQSWVSVHPAEQLTLTTRSNTLRIMIYLKVIFFFLKYTLMPRSFQTHFVLIWQNYWWKEHTITRSSQHKHCKENKMIK